MSNFTVTKKGERLIATRFGIPYGLFLAIYSRYALWIIFPVTVVLAEILPFSQALALNLLITWTWSSAYIYMHPK